MRTFVSKIIAVAVIFCISFFASLLPIKLKHVFDRWGSKGRTVLSVLMAFGGGVFLGTFLLHMLPECQMLLDYYWLNPRKIMYPVTQLIISLGFLLVLVLDRVVEHWALTHAQSKHEVMPLCKPAEYQGEYMKDSDPGLTQNGKESCSRAVDKDEKDSIPADRQGSGKSPSDEQNEEVDPHDFHVHNARALVLLMALSFHRLFEGMSLGLQATNSFILSLTIAISCHEAVVGFSLGLKLVKNNWSTGRIVLALFLCSLLQAIGGVIGTGISEATIKSDEVQITSGILQALATGTFVYVTFFEILPSHTQSAAHVVSVTVGVAVMAALAALDSESMSAMVTPT